mmetsp:Transcript_82202/g.228077  ORF Transcript_82202/g.228077 Transcript_82202/m.228077 type:complete len:331 (-) Transcript_82202:959-1951(-)
MDRHLDNALHAVPARGIEDAEVDERQVREELKDDAGQVPQKQQVLAQDQPVSPMPTAEVDRPAPWPPIADPVRACIQGLLLSALEVNVKYHREDARLPLHEHHRDALVIQPSNGLVEALQVFFRVEDKHSRLRKVRAALETGVRQPVAFRAIVCPEPLQCALKLHELSTSAELPAETPVPLLQLPQTPPSHLLLACDPANCRPIRGLRCRCLRSCYVLAVWLWWQQAVRFAFRLTNVRLAVTRLQCGGHAEDRAAQVHHVFHAHLLGQLWAETLASSRDIQPLDLQAPGGQAASNQQGDGLAWPAVRRQTCEGSVAVPCREADGAVKDGE